MIIINKDDLFEKSVNRSELNNLNFILTEFLDFNSFQLL